MGSEVYRQSSTALVGPEHVPLRGAAEGILVGREVQHVIELELELEPAQCAWGVGVGVGERRPSLRNSTSSL